METFLFPFLPLLCPFLSETNSLLLRLYDDDDAPSKVPSSKNAKTHHRGEHANDDVDVDDDDDDEISNDDAV